MASYNNYSRNKSNNIPPEERFKYNKLREQRGLSQDSRYKNFDELELDWRKYCGLWRSYPDYFLDFIRDDNCKIRLFFFQRIFLRLIFRFRRVFITATRGTSKTYICILAMYLLCIFYPGIKLFLCAPGKEQAAKIGQEKLEDIWSHFPILKDEIVDYKKSKDYTKLVFRHGSRMDVVQQKDAARGGRRHGGLVEEAADEHTDGNMINSVIIPLMADKRIAMCGGNDPYEIHKREMYMTTAGTRQSFAFTKLKDVYKDMFAGKSAIAVGAGYELPCDAGLLDLEYIMEQQEDESYNPLSFAREFESVWTGSSENSLIDLEKLQRCRTLKYAEDKATDKDAEYVIGYDVARAEGALNANSAMCVIKIVPKGNGEYSKSLVNMFGIKGTHFREQALFIKQMVAIYKGTILVVDTNGLGRGLVDELVLDIDENPIYSVVNDDRFDKYKVPNSIPMIYSMIAHTKGHANSDMYNVFVQNINGGKLKMLRTASDAKVELLKKRGMDSERLMNELRPYLAVDLFAEEVMNLEYKQRGNQTDVKQISRAIPKDKFSAVVYALYWIYLKERENKKRQEEKFDWADMVHVGAGKAGIDKHVSWKG